MKVFISGASGLVGGNCLAYFKAKNWNVVGSHMSFPTPETVYYNTLKLGTPDNFNLIQFSPDVIIHCGALTHVDYCEENKAESFEKNVTSTLALIKIANQCNAKLIFLSTDYVFDGVKGPYNEDDQTNPLNVYGQHKLLAEQEIKTLCNDYLILRVTNVYGDEIRNKNFVSRIIQQIKESKPLQFNLPIDQYATPTNALDIAKAMFLLINSNKKGLYHIASTDYMNRVELALNVINAFTYKDYILHHSDTNSLHQTATRPLNGGLLKHKFNFEFPDFTFSTLHQYLNEKKENIFL